MNLESWEFFNYELPDEKIAKRPVWFDDANRKRGNSRLLHFSAGPDRTKIIDRQFEEICDLLKSGDVLVLNKTKVLNARFIFESDGMARELLLCKRVGDNWLALARPMKEFKEGLQIKLSEDLKAQVLGKDANSRFLNIRLFQTKDSKRELVDQELIDELILQQGHIPIPPYIRQGNSDEYDLLDYQTVYAKESGSVAAPTAGLHFSEQILKTLKAKGVNIQYLTLHVGPASFLPVNDPLNHHPMPELYSIAKDTWEAILEAKVKGRVIAVGTTVIRALEAFERLSQKEDKFNLFQETDLFIKDGFNFKVVDCCFTNFHQPRSTHLLLVSALVGKKHLELIYEHALENNYRFLSYGDSSFLELKECH